MKVLDVGCAMGFFSLPLAKMVGSSRAVLLGKENVSL